MGRIKPVGYESEKVGRKYKYHRGHIIANRLGGSGKDERNLTTLYADANTPAMRLHEGDVAGVVKRGENIRYNVEPVYLGNESLAKGITLDARGDKGYRMYVTVLNRRGN